MERECLQTELTPWTIGPYHASLPAAMRVSLMLDGEIVVSAQVEAGFLHRGLEKAMERSRWHALVAYADHLDPECAAFGELALCMAAETAGRIEVPERARIIRTILAELSRVSSHLLYLAKVSRAVAAGTMVHYVLRDRERILDLFELLTGMRFSLDFIRFGGVSADMTEGFIERVLEICELLRIRLKEYNDLLTFNRSFLDRTVGVGLLGRELALKHGVSGPNARAAGLGIDLRKQLDQLSYGSVDIEVPVIRHEGRAAGDCHDRFVTRLREISQSIEILKGLCDRVLPGEHASIRVEHEFVLPAGEAYSRLESSRGILGCHLVSEGQLRPARVQFRTPSVASLRAVPEVMPGVRLEDVPVVLASLDLSLAEVDR